MRRDVVAVAPADVPAERAELRLDVAEIADLRRPRCPTGSCCGRRSRRSRRAAWCAADASDSQNCPSCSSPSPVSTKMRRGVPASRLAMRHALGLRDAHAERAGVGLDVRRLDVRMAGQAVQPAQLVELLGRQQPEADQHRVERRRVVPLRREEDVAGRRALVEIAHLVQEQPAHDLERAEAGADVARPGARDHVERVDARQRRERLGARRRGGSRASSRRRNSATGT